MADPDKGVWQFEYNALGEVLKQTDAIGQTRSMTYDALGRLVDQIDRRANGTPEKTSTWTFDTAPNGVGMIAMEVAVNGNYSKVIDYDNFGRPAAAETTIDLRKFTEQTTYDRHGRVRHNVDASGRGILNTYESNGMLRAQSEATGANEMRYEVLDVTAFGQVSRERRGGSIVTARNHSGITGRVESIITAGHQDLHYRFDYLGNLTSREDRREGARWKESFTYDTLNRLDDVSKQQIDASGAGFGPNFQTMDLAYDQIGNLLSKTDIGSYTYGRNLVASCNRAGAVPAGFNAVTVTSTATSTVSRCYDANGNEISTSNGRQIDYNVANLPTKIARGMESTEFRYGPSGQRYARIENGSTTTYYVGAVEITPSTNLTKRNVAGMVQHISGSTVTTYYQLTDHLGSVDVLLTVAGVEHERMSFDAHGMRRNVSTWVTLEPSVAAMFASATTRFGYTGHEQVDRFGLIHMNGRIYDPLIGRFVQADPLVEDAFNTQGINRFSYVLNNPLSLTDPTGHLSWAQIRPYVGIAVAIALGQGGIAYGLWGSMSISNPLLIKVLTGAIAGAISTGSVQGAVIGAFSAGLNHYIGEGVGKIAGIHGANAARAASLALHGIRGGIVAKLQGGKFGSGFKTAGLTETFSPLAGAAGDSIWTQTAVAAIIGGTISELMGDKFANGAGSAAFAQLFNHAGDKGGEAPCTEDPDGSMPV